MDYRSALRQRSGVGEYTHHAAAALQALARAGDRPLDLSCFSSSWRDRLALPADLAGAVAVDCRVPVRLLNLAWHRLGVPPVEWLTGRRWDVTHSMHPLLLPAWTGARLVTIYDLYFLEHPEAAAAEIRRDYPALVRRHARRADHIVVISDYTRRAVCRTFDIPEDRVSLCPPGRPEWAPRERPPAHGYLLFLGTLEPRKNIGWLLDAYEQVLRTRPHVPRLVLAGGATPAAAAWLARLQQPPLQGHVEYRGYVPDEARRELYAGASVVIQPSLDEGFGMPVLEAMATGVPVVAARAGALPEVGADAVTLVTPNDVRALAEAINAMLERPDRAEEATARGLRRARHYAWEHTARQLYDAYTTALTTHRRRRTMGA